LIVPEIGRYGCKLIRVYADIPWFVTGIARLFSILTFCQALGELTFFPFFYFLRLV
jgi:hypothetical protein